MTFLIIWYQVLFCLYLSSPISLRKLIVLKTYLWTSPLFWDISELSRLIAVGEIKQKLHKTLWCVFFETPCTVRSIACKNRYSDVTSSEQVFWQFHVWTALFAWGSLNSCSEVLLSEQLFLLSLIWTSFNHTYMTENF